MESINLVPFPGSEPHPLPAEGRAAPPPSTSEMTLYAIEQHLIALADSTELVTAEQEQEFLSDFREALLTARDKRDAVGHFMAELDDRITFADAEIRRLQDRKAMFRRALDRMERYVIGIIEGMGLDAKGKTGKLEGKTVTLSLRKCPPSVEISDEAEVPDSCKTASVTLPMPLWNDLLDALDVEVTVKVQETAKVAAIVSKTAVKAAIESGEAISGADLVLGKYSLVRK